MELASNADENLQDVQPTLVNSVQVYRSLRHGEDAVSRLMILNEVE